MPRWTLAARPGLEARLLRNQEALVSPWDIHATLLDLVAWPEAAAPCDDGDARPVSLLAAELGEDRSCADAAITPSHCLCERWRQSPDGLARRNAMRWLFEATVDHFNRLVGAAGSGVCQPLSFASVKAFAWIDDAQDLASNASLYTFEVTTGQGLLPDRPNRYLATVVVTGDDHTVASASQVTFLDIKQVTRYNVFEPCTPPGADPQYCVCGQY